MSSLQQAFQQVGYKPPVRKPAPTLEKLIDEVINPITKQPKKIQVQEQGGYYRARLVGRRVSCFDLTRERAIKKLEFFCEVGL